MGFIPIVSSDGEFALAFRVQVRNSCRIGNGCETHWLGRWSDGEIAMGVKPIVWAVGLVAESKKNATHLTMGFIPIVCSGE